MHISAEGRISALLGIIGLVGAGLPMVAPSYPSFGWILIALAVAGYLALACHHAFSKTIKDKKPGHERKMIALYGMLASGFGFVGCGVAYLWPAKLVSNAISQNTSDSALDYTIKLRCDHYTPTEGSEVKDTWYYNIYMTPPPYMDPREAISTQPVVAGTKTRTDPADVGKNGSQLRCRLYNQGDKIITSAQFRFTIQWMVDGLTDPKDPGGANIAPAEYISPPLDMGNEESNREAYFYIVNTSDSLLHIVPAETVEIKVAGSDNLITSKLVSGNQFHNRVLLFAGRHFTKTLNASHPTPTLPTSPAGK